MPSGRKSIKEEIGVLQRYNELSDAYFNVIKTHLESNVKKDQQWAVERLDKAFAKMIPTQIGGLDGKPIEVSWLSSPTDPDTGQKSSTKRPIVGFV